MKKTGFILCLILFLDSNLFSQTKVGDVTVPNTMSAGGKNLILNGSGIRKKYLMDMYVGALYLVKKEKDPTKVILANEAMIIKLHIVSSMITSSRMEEAITDGFKNSTYNTGIIKDKIAQFKTVFKEEVKIGDIFDFVYTPAEGVIVYKNNAKKITLTGLDFKKALYGIWLGKYPADEGLKEGMMAAKEE